MNRHRRITLTRLQWEGVYLLYWTLLLGVVYDIDAKGELSLLAAGAGVVISLGLLLTGFGKGVRIRYPQVRTNSGLQWGGEYVVGSGVFSLLVGVKTDLPASVIWGGFLLSFLVGATLLVLYARRSARLDVQTRAKEGDAQVHQLGALRQEYSVRLSKLLALYVSGIGLVALLVALNGGTFVDFIAVGIMVVLLPFGGAFISYRQLHVHVYTYGLLYLDGDYSRTVRWEQISKVSTGS